jgi:hypothetical protein
LAIWVERRFVETCSPQNLQRALPGEMWTRCIHHQHEWLSSARQARVGTLTPGDPSQVLYAGQHAAGTHQSDVIPPVCTMDDLARIFRVSRRTLGSVAAGVPPGCFFGLELGYEVFHDCRIGDVLRVWRYRVDADELLRNEVIGFRQVLASAANAGGPEASQLEFVQRSTDLGVNQIQFASFNGHGVLLGESLPKRPPARAQRLYRRCRNRLHVNSQTRRTTAADWPRAGQLIRQVHPPPGRPPEETGE